MEAERELGVDKKKMIKEKPKGSTRSIVYHAISFAIVMLTTGAIVSGIKDFHTEHVLSVARTQYKYNLNEMDSLIKSNERVFKKAMEAQKDGIAVKEHKQFVKGLTEAMLKLQPKLDREVADKIVKHLIKQSEINELDPILIAAIIYEESRFNPMAHSNKGAVGLMQVRYSTWKKQSVLKDNGVSAKSKLYWIDLNILVGTKIFADYYKESKYNIVKALHRYNSGSPSLPKGKSEHEISYANKVLLTAFKIKTIVSNITEIPVEGGHGPKADN